MASWDWRGTGGTREGLTVYQLQQLVSSGRARAEDEVRTGESSWKCIADVPSLARFLPATSAPPAGRTTTINGVVLELDADGKPVPPSPDVIARLLVQSSDADEQKARVARIRRVATAVALVMLLGISFLLLRILTFQPE